MSRVFDCFSFFNEFDVLDIRLNTLDPVVDIFVIAELSITHQGNSKPFNLEQNKERYQKFWHKIRYIKHDYNWWEENTWIREHYQRDTLLGGLYDLQDDDIVMVSDVDEIPRWDTVVYFKPEHGCRAVEHRTYNYYLNCYAGIPVHQQGVGLKIASGSYFKSVPNLIQEIQVNGMGSSATHLRYRVMPDQEIIKDGGWHFSWQGGQQKVIEKLESFAHIELNREEHKDPNVLSLIDKGEEPFVYGIRHHKIPHTFVKIDHTFPPYVVWNEEMLKAKGMIRYDD